jgi:putative transposase
MRKSRFSEEQIIGILKEHQAGLSAADLCRKHGISDATFYNWRSRFGGMEVSEAKRLRALEEENGKLKRLLADAMLDVSTLREMLGKTSDARFEERCRELGDEREGLFAAPRLRAGRHGAGDLPVRLGQAGRQHSEKQVARDGERAPPLRLPAPAPAAETGGRGDQP